MVGPDISGNFLLSRTSKGIITMIVIKDGKVEEKNDIIKKGNDYGWPVCYGQNINDRNFDKNIYIVNPCMNKTPPHIELQAHSAPLGLSFIPEEGWPENYWNDLIVSYHGSWNRKEKTGYKLVHIKLDDLGNVTNKTDFITGWIDEKENIYLQLIVFLVL
ncbi:MAG: hypothetical protein QM490_04175 [Candidatus Gracilibacteria bacterium]